MFPEYFALIGAQHIRYGLTPLPFGTLLSSVATSVYARKVIRIVHGANKRFKGGGKNAK